MIRLTRIAALILLAFVASLAILPASNAQVAIGVSIRIGPPALPVYTQPVCPGAGYIWTPGYWAYGPAGYYWVPGTWVLAPTPGYLWTPGYWGWGGGVYVWHAGYWGPHVGFYGGINYGYGYSGVGFVGGEWRGGVFHYNTAVTNVNTTIIHNTYVNNTVVNRTVVTNVSYNGGAGGTTAHPSTSEEAAMREHHFQATSLQTQHEQMARNDHTMLASVNHGRPAVAATARPAVFKGEGVVAARTANVNNNRPTPNSNGHMDRPPNSRTDNINNHPVDRRQTAVHQENTQTNTNRSNANKPRTEQSNGQRTNNVRPNSNATQAPQPQHENRPPEHESHEGGHSGRGR
jgi:WXXGXW repeat (2 copies)